MPDYDTRWKEAASMIRETLGQEGLDAIAAEMRSAYELVSDESDACPNCHEDRIDWLTWDDDEKVTCASCETVYVP